MIDLNYVILCKSQLDTMYEVYKKYVSNTFLNIIKQINKYEVIQTKYLFTLNWFIDYSKIEEKRYLEN